MPVPASLASLSTTAGSNPPAGTENPFPDLDDHLRAGYAFDAQNRDAIATKLNASAVSAFGLTLIDDTSAAAARTTLGAVGLTGDETVAGIKTFSSSPVVPTPTTGDNTTKVATTAFVKTTADASAASAVADRSRVSLTATQSGSGVSIDFTGIASWAKRITVTFTELSTNGSNNPVLQIGSGALKTTGYAGSQTLLTAGVATGNLSSGFQLGGASASSIRNGVFTLVHQGGNVWACNGGSGFSDSAGVAHCAGYVSLSGVLDRLSLSAGGDSFDGGSVSILIEG